jgi:hypothetical protein
MACSLATAVFAQNAGAEASMMERPSAHTGSGINLTPPAPSLVAPCNSVVLLGSEFSFTWEPHESATSFVFYFQTASGGIPDGAAESYGPVLADVEGVFGWGLEAKVGTLTSPRATCSFSVTAPA